ncbi:MAG: N-acetylmuramoyl-L-alanine amidase [Woeseiaceae bacterium]|nr:N-acetylmuramoyl-L-alanine amidase [Woeseiaceae bacterium]
MARIRLTTCALLLLLSTAVFAGSTVENVRIWSENDKTRVVLDLSRSVDHSIFKLRDPSRLVIDLKDSRLGKAFAGMPKGTGLVREIRSGVRADGQLRVVLDLSTAVRSRTFAAGPNAAYGDRLVIDLQREGSLAPVKRAAEAYQPGRDIIIAIDPGHGGRDPGTSGRYVHEKEIVLALSKELARKINAEPGMRALLIRDRDVYVGHGKRVAIAHQNNADLFVSVHADGFGDKRAAGASVFALNLDRANREARKAMSRLPGKEEVKVGDVVLNDKDRVLASVLFDLSQSATMSASLEVGDHVRREMGRVAKMHKNVVKEKSLAVLTSAEMPSILVEAGFLTNPAEEKRLRDKKYRGRLANAILAGVRSYFYTNPPPDTQIAMDLKREPARQVRHVVARGDTVSEIAERYNVSTSDIRRANKLRNDKIRVGQTLSIPIFAGGY